MPARRCALGVPMAQDDSIIVDCLWAALNLRPLTKQLGGRLAVVQPGAFLLGMTLLWNVHQVTCPSFLSEGVEKWK